VTSSGKAIALSRSHNDMASSLTMPECGPVLETTTEPWQFIDDVVSSAFVGGARDLEVLVDALFGPTFRPRRPGLGAAAASSLSGPGSAEFMSSGNCAPALVACSCSAAEVIGAAFRTVGR
jgi:hypothetical protein